MRQRLEKEIQTTKAALKRQKEEEAAAANKALLLAEELERQHREQADADGLRQQVNAFCFYVTISFLICASVCIKID